ncbi:hypothetical protein FBEOM_4869 [Fusarium beomiforme]|uniref:Integral membrane protein n=1 Tax=Fusarium beomiforme TaxID=44412 RepID=A0A9P5AM10_9HYPO|nr:hypothetical protein FBEOM_4869 [Fusarium beomiforme]
MASSSTVQKDIAIACICSTLILSRCGYRIYHWGKGHSGSHRIWHTDDIYMAVALVPLVSRTVCIALSFSLNPSSSRDPVTKAEAEAEHLTVEKLEYNRVVGLQLLIGTRISYTLILWIMKAALLSFYTRFVQVTHWGKIAVKALWCLLIVSCLVDVEAQSKGNTKIQLGILFSIGILLITITIVRIPLILNQAMSQKSRSTWASIEILCSCIVANTPFFYGLLRELGHHKGTHPSVTDPSRSVGPFYLQSKGADHREYELESVKKDEDNNSRELIITP